MPAHRPYHHGNLRPALVEAAALALADVSPHELSLRDLARQTGVSHAAPAHHFGDKAGLLTAVATLGFDRLTTALRQAALARAGSQGNALLKAGEAYVRFATDQPALFSLMFQPALYHKDDPDLLAARQRGAQALAAISSGDGLGALGAWALVHGFSELWLNGNLDPALDGDPALAFRDVAQAFADILTPRS